MPTSAVESYTKAFRILKSNTCEPLIATLPRSIRFQNTCRHLFGDQIHPPPLENAAPVESNTSAPACPWGGGEGEGGLKCGAPPSRHSRTNPQPAFW